MYLTELKWTRNSDTSNYVCAFKLNASQMKHISREKKYIRNEQKKTKKKNAYNTQHISNIDECPQNNIRSEYTCHYNATPDVLLNA